ncbi:hypothetical protein Tco_0537784 [Tanacetum coccineum]
MWCRELVHLAPPAVHEESNALDNATALERAWLVETHAGCEDTIRQLMHARQLSQHNSRLYSPISARDYALVYAERINVERAQEKEKLVTQLRKTEIEKFYCVRKLLPIMVERLLQSYEYKKSLSKPFNLAIQGGKGLAEERSKEDLLEIMGRVEGFDPYADKKMNVEYDKLFKK